MGWPLRDPIKPGRHASAVRSHVSVCGFQFPAKARSKTGSANRETAATGIPTVVPHFDPAEAGVRTRVLCVFEAPGPMTNACNKRPGSGFISADNNDQAMSLLLHSRDDDRNSGWFWLVPFRSPTMDPTHLETQKSPGEKSLPTGLFH